MADLLTNVSRRYQRGKLTLAAAIVELFEGKTGPRMIAETLDTSLERVYQTLYKKGLVDAREAVLKLYISRQDINGIEIAQWLKISHGRVYQILRSEDIPIRARPRKPSPPPKPVRARVVDKILRYLSEHPNSTVAEITDGIGHPNQGTVGQILSRHRVDGYVVSAEDLGFTRDTRKEPHLWTLTKEAEPLLKESLARFDQE